MSMTNRVELTGGEAIVAALKANGIDSVFGLPGAQMYPLFDALQRESAAIRTYGARHEQATAYMAFGYARATGRPGVFSVVPGPGVLNATAALCTAWGACAPVLCLTGQVPSAFLGKGRGHLHELPDQLATMKSLCKWAARIERPADAPAIINEAFRQMLSGRPGPVCVEMAWDVMASREVVELLPAADIPAAAPPDPAQVEAAARLLLGATCPLILTGSGAQHASAEIRELAEYLDAPVAAFRGGRGVMPEDRELGISSYAAFRLWPQVDAVIGIGTRMELPTMRWTGMMTLVDQPQSPPHWLRIDIDPAEFERLKVHGPILADAADGARALLEAVRRLGRKPTGNREHIATVKAEAAMAIQKVQPQMGWLDAIRTALPRDGILVEELCQAGFTSYFGYPVLKPRSYISPGFQGTLGFGFMSALGVKVAHPDRKVVSITGDGGFLFGVQELATAAQENIALVTVLFDNGAYGNVLRDQHNGFGGREIGSRLRNPDFMALAKSFGVKAIRVKKPQALRPALAEALSLDQPVLVVVDVEPGSEASPWEFIHAKR